MTEWGVLSLTPMLVALVIAFRTRSAAFSLLAGCIIGVILLGLNPARGLTELFQRSLGNGEFIQVNLIVCLLGILFALLKETGAIGSFAMQFSKTRRSPRRIAFTTWAMGFFIVDDYFSPLMSGAIMRPLTDSIRMSREKLAFILDSTTASVCILVPFAAWGAYFTGLILAQGGPVETSLQAIEIFIHAIPYNFYPILLILFTLGICLRIIPDYGPMRLAEKRALETGELIRKGSTPLITTDSADILNNPSGSVSLILYLLVPVVLLFGTAIGSFIFINEVRIAEAIMLAVGYLTVLMFFKKQLTGAEQLVAISTQGVKDVIPAVIIISLAYSINAVTQELGAANYLIAISQGYLTPELLVASTFLLTAFISFSTGTSWGAFAMMVPIALPLAYGYTDNQIDPLIFKTVAAIAGGGIFGDHASPVSDTSVLSSAGAGSDHMDHVITQLPYALTVAIVTTAIYLII